VISADERRHQLESELASIAHVMFQVADRVKPTSASKENTIVLDSPGDNVPPERQLPLLRDLLIRRLGSEAAATDLSNRILSASRKLFALSVQYHELSKRYNGIQMDNLIPGLRPQVLTLAQQMEQSLAEELQSQDQMLRPLLADYPMPTSAKPSNTWQDRAASVFALTSAQDRILSLLFAVTAGESHDQRNIDVI